MTTKLLFSFLFLPACAVAQTARMPASLAYTKLTAYSNQFADAFSFSANQGALAAQTQFSAGVYSERRFLLKALTASSAAIVVPTVSGNFGFKVDYVGDPAYNESSLGLAYARSLGSKVAVGIQFNYVRMATTGYGAASILNFDAAALFHLSPQVNAGLHIYNPVANGWGKEALEKLPAIYSFGLGYDVSPDVFVGAEIEKVEDQPVGVNAGLHYQVAARLIARAGIQSATASYYLGFGIKLKRFRFDVTASLHPYLGLTPGSMLLYSAKE